MRAGLLRQVVSLQSHPAGVPDSMGAPSGDWTTVFSGIRAEVTLLTGREFMSAQALNSEITTRIRIRYCAGVLATWRVLWGTRIFEIVSVGQPGLRPEILELMCREVKTGATAAVPSMPAPTITSITPATAPNNAAKAVVLAGTGFLRDAAVKLTKTGQTDISATAVVLASDTSLTCSLPISGAAAGSWSVVLTNLDTQTATLAGSFTVTEAA